MGDEWTEHEALAHQLVAHTHGGQGINDEQEVLALAVDAGGHVFQCIVATEAAQADSTIGFMLVLSAGAVLAICGALIAWLKWRHPPDNK